MKRRGCIMLLSIACTAFRNIISSREKTSNLFKYWELNLWPTILHIYRVKEFSTLASSCSHLKILLLSPHMVLRHCCALTFFLQLQVKTLGESFQWAIFLCYYYMGQLVNCSWNKLKPINITYKTQTKRILTHLPLSWVPKMSMKWSHSVVSKSLRPHGCTVHGI